MSTNRSYEIEVRAEQSVAWFGLHCIMAGSNFTDSLTLTARVHIRETIMIHGVWDMGRALYVDMFWRYPYMTALLSLRNWFEDVLRKTKLTYGDCAKTE